MTSQVEQRNQCGRHIFERKSILFMNNFSAHTSDTI